jgi:hypothetical protein
MEAAGMAPEDVDAHWNTVTDPETYDHKPPVSREP